MGRVRAAARTPWVPFVVVAAALVALQLLLIPMDRPPGWDETIYLSQADPDVPDLLFVASRARGIVVLVWPLVRLGLSLEAIRIVLAVVSSVALVAAASCWRRVLSPSAAAATAAVIGMSWPFLLGGSEIMPNRWTAVLLLGAAGGVAGTLGDRVARPPWWALALVVAAGVVRPLDAVVFVAGTAAAVLWARGRWTCIAWLTGAALAGTIPWLVETSIRYGGVGEALEVARSCGHVVSGVGPVDRLAGYLAPPDGAVLAGIPVLAAAWWIAVIGLGATTAFGQPSRATTAARVGLATALALGGVYVVLVSAASPRFLMPAAALAVAAAAARLPRLGRRGLVVLTALAVLWGGWQVAVARDVGRALRPADFTPLILAADRPCLDGTGS